jgi:hypothetical protein
MNNLPIAREKFSDEKLYALCKKYGENALYYRRKFIGLLPEVYKRKLYEKKKFGSIFEFAARICGVSEEQVRRVLNIEKRFEDKPILKEMLVNGEVSANKLAKIASIATTENQQALATQVKLLPCRALEVLARDERLGLQEAGYKNVDGLQKPLFEVKSVHVNTIEPRFDDDVKQQLAELQEKGIDINHLIRQMLAKREEDFEKRKNNAAEDAKPANSRYISVTVRKILHEEYGDKCSIRGCGKPASRIHHSQRFALAGLHDPRYMAPMCAEHHQIAHSIDLKFHVASGFSGICQSAGHDDVQSEQCQD